MKHPKRAITRDIRTRRPKRVAREAAELETLVWPETTVRVKDVMTRPAVTFREAMTVGAAVTAMRARKIRHAPVLDAKGALVGIVSDRDLRQVVLEPVLAEEMEPLAQALRTRTVKDVMTWTVITVKPEAEIRQAAGTMHTNKIGALPVVERGKVVGMLTGDDVLKTLVELLDEGVLSKPGRWGAEG